MFMVVAMCTTILMTSSMYSIFKFSSNSLAELSYTAYTSSTLAVGKVSICNKVVKSVEILINYYNNYHFNL